MNFCDYEMTATLSVASIAARSNIDLAEIYTAWNESGWEEEIEALQEYIKLK